MRRKGEKIPEDHIRCPKCESFYGFVKCRVTLHDPHTRNLCLSCAGAEARDKIQVRAGEVGISRRS